MTYARWVAGIERHRRAIVGMSMLLSLLSALSLTRLRLDFDVLGMLPSGRPEFDEFKAFIEDFRELDELLVLVRGESPDHLRAFADEIAARLAALPSVGRVHARVDLDALERGVFGTYLYNYLPESAYAELVARLEPAGIEAQVRASRTMLGAPFDLGLGRTVAEDPLGIRRLAARAVADGYETLPVDAGGGYFAAPDGHALLVFVEPRASAFDVAFSARLLREVRRAEAGARAARPDADVRVDYTGSYVYALEDATTLRLDVGRYAVLALAAVLAVFWTGYRSLRILPFVAWPLVVSSLLTFALSLVLFARLNAVSLSFAAILYGLSIDSGIHFYGRLLQERRRLGDREAVTATLAGLGRAQLAASLTTAGVFVVIGFSRLAAVRQLGLLTAAGVMITAGQFFTLYPALGFALVRRHRGLLALETPRLAWVAARAAAQARLVVLAAGVIGVGLLAAAARLDWDVALTSLRPRRSEAARVDRDIEGAFGRRMWDGAVLVHRATMEEALVTSEAIGRRLRTYRGEGMLEAFLGVEAVLPSAETQRRRLALHERLPREEAAARLAAALARHGFALEPFREFLADLRRPRTALVEAGDPALEAVAPLLARHLRAREDGYIVATYVRSAPGVGPRAVVDRLRGDLGGTAFRFAGRALMEDELGRVLRRELALFLVLALGANFTLLRAGLGDSRAAAAVLAPCMLVVVALCAAMGWFGIPLGPVNLLALPLVIGLGVDDGVYIVAAAREHGGLGEALRRSGRAVVMTSLTTVTGFGFLSLSRHPTLASFGLLAGAGLLLCLVASLVLLPALLTVLGAVPGEGTRAPALARRQRPQRS